MTREEIIALARESGIVVTGEAVWRLCELVAAAEREAIWNFIFEYAGRHDLSDSDQSLLKYIADAIRARGER